MTPTKYVPFPTKPKPPADPLPNPGGPINDGPPFVDPSPPVFDNTDPVGRPGKGKPEPEEELWLDITPSDPSYANRTASNIQERTLTRARIGAVIPEIYGRDRVGGNIARAITYNGNLLLLVVWCQGEIDAIERVLLNGETFEGEATHYTGTATQTGDPTITAAFGQADALPGIAYSVLEIPPGNGLDIQAIIRGRKIYDPRTGLKAFSTNAGLAIADFFDRYTVHPPKWLSAETLADHCDELVAGAKRWEIGLTMLRQRDVSDWIKTLRGYANCFVALDGGEVRFIPDAPAPVTKSFGTGDIVRDSLEFTILGQREAPTQVAVSFTAQNAGEPWADDWAETPETPSGVPERVSRLSYPGFPGRRFARRKAIQIQNESNLTDMGFRVVVFDDGLEVLRGEVIELFHPMIGITKPFRVHDCVPTERGRWLITGREYDPAVYSNQIETEPTFPDTGLPNPNNVPDGPIPDLIEALFVDEAGRTFSRIEARFQGLAWPFVGSYRVRVKAQKPPDAPPVDPNEPPPIVPSGVVQESVIAHAGVDVEHVAVTAAVTQDVEYVVEVWTISVYGRQGAVPGVATLIPEGKRLLPTAPTNGRGREAGQFVSLWWDPAMDIDLVGYRVKRIPLTDYQVDVAGAWASGQAVTVVQRIDAERVLLEMQPVGDFVYMVKALDSLGQESDDEEAPYGRTDIFVTVTEDGAGGATLVDLLADLGTLVNMHYTERFGDAAYVVTSSGRTWIDIFGAVGSGWSDTVASGTLWTAGENGVSSMRTVEWDVGEDREANWSWSVLAIPFGGGTITKTTRFAKENDYPTFSTEAGTSFSGEARYLVAFLECTGGPGEGMLVRLPVVATYQGTVRVERRTENIPAVGQPLSITWNKNFLTPPEVSVQLLGSLPRTVTADNITAAGCDLYAWDSTDAPAAATVRVIATGT